MSRQNPLEEIERIFDRMSRELGSGDLELDIGHEVPVDVEDTGESYVVTADLPGFERDDLSVELTGARLHVGADREAETEEERTVGEERYLRRERHRESVSRSVRLPDPVDADAVEAAYANGVLTVTLPKREGGDSRTIDIA
jgi:HSP20 family protein